MRVVKFLLSGVLLFAICLCLFACGKPKSDEEMITERIDSFVNAYNTGDLDAVLDCMDAKTRNSFKGQFELAENLGSDLLGYSFDVYSMFGVGIGMTSEDDALEVSNLNIDMKGEEKATVEVDMSIQGVDGGFSDKGYFTMLKENDDWYIKDFEG